MIAKNMKNYYILSVNKYSGESSQLRVKQSLINFLFDAKYNFQEYYLYPIQNSSVYRNFYDLLRFKEYFKYCKIPMAIKTLNPKINQKL